VTNQGVAATTSKFWSAAFLDQQVTPINNAWNQFNPLAAGSTASANNSFSTDGLSVGTHTLWIQADPYNDSNNQFNSGNNDVTEANESNNWTSVTFDVTAPPQPDLVISSITSAATVAQGSNYNYSFVLANQGLGSATSKFWATAFLDQQVTPINSTPATTTSSRATRPIIGARSRSTSPLLPCRPAPLG
jgi:hypothetical protein